MTGNPYESPRVTEPLAAVSHSTVQVDLFGVARSAFHCSSMALEEVAAELQIRLIEHCRDRGLTLVNDASKGIRIAGTIQSVEESNVLGFTSVTVEGMVRASRDSCRDFKRSVSRISRLGLFVGGALGILIVLAGGVLAAAEGLPSGSPAGMLFTGAALSIGFGAIKLFSGGRAAICQVLDQIGEQLAFEVQLVAVPANATRGRIGSRYLLYLAIISALAAVGVGIFVLLRLSSLPASIVFGLTFVSVLLIGVAFAPSRVVHSRAMAWLTTSGSSLRFLLRVLGVLLAMIDTIVILAISFGSAGRP